jgi:hypothetical protein
MAVTVNERDVLLSQSTTRVIAAPVPNAIVIPGYTGLTLSRSPLGTWYATGSGKFPPVFPEQIEIAIAYKGIPATQAAVWACNVPLTDTPNPLIKLIEARNYPADLRQTVLTVTVNYAGQDFVVEARIPVFNG